MIGNNNSFTWICTDSDCSQYCRKLRKRKYQFVEILSFGYVESDTMYTVKSAFIDLNDYTKEEVEKIISSYYGSLEALYNYYSDEDAEEIIAECIFEEMNDGSETTHGMMTRNEAEKFIKRYISQ